jgi:hypothetical protein
MASRGSTKALSVAQENHIADVYEGVRSPSSGGADNDQGDVRTPSLLIECKLTGGPGRPSYGEDHRPHLSRVMEKVAEEAWTEDREPVVCLRFFDPLSKLANTEGWVDLTVRLTHEDVHRDRLFNQVSEMVN